MSIFNGLFVDLWGIFLVVFFFGGSIFIHELGHFLAAKRRGLAVPRFSIGFGPKLVSWTRNGTEYRISLLPLGGYVSIPQLAEMKSIEGDFPELAGQHLKEPSYSDKLIVSVMGAAFNALFALVLALLLWWVGQPFSASEVTTQVGYVQETFEVDGVISPSPAFEAGLRPGDRIVSIDGQPVADFQDIIKDIVMGTGRAEGGRPVANIEIERDGARQVLTLHPVLIDTNKLSRDAMRFIGISPASDIVVSATTPNSPATTAGLLPGDRIVGVNGSRLYSLLSLQDAVQKEHPLQLEIVRQGAILQKELMPMAVPFTRPYVQWTLEGGGQVDIFPHYENKTPAIQQSQPNTFSELVVLNSDVPDLMDVDMRVLAVNDSTAKSIECLAQATVIGQNRLELSSQGNLRRLNLDIAKQALVPSKTYWLLGIEMRRDVVLRHIDPWTQFRKSTEMTFGSLFSLVDTQSDLKLQSLMGPTGIVRTMHAFSKDLRMLIWFVILINVNLAILNLLPIPILDGGHILFATIEKVTRRRLSPGFIHSTQAVFLTLFLALMIYITFFDILRWKGDRTSEAELQKSKLLNIERSF